MKPDPQTPARRGALAALLLALAASAHAGPRTSAAYAIPAETADAGGTRATSATYTHDGSLGGVAGISTAATPAATAKHGYLGQPEHKALTFSPRYADRTYGILTSTTLEPDTWSALPGGIVSDDGDVRTVTDPNATAGKKFYRVEITKP